MKKRQNTPVRLAKKPEKKPLIKANSTIADIPLEFILITIIMVSFFALIVILMGPCTDSGLWFNRPHV